MTYDIVIHRPVDDVYRYYVNVDNFSEWSESITKVDREGDGDIQPGEVFVVHVSVNGNDFVVPHQVIAVEPGRRFSYRCDRPIPCQWDVLFEPSADGTRMAVSVTMDLDAGDAEMRKRLPPKEVLEAKEQASLRAIKAILDQPSPG